MAISYHCEPANFLTRCDGCGQLTSVRHALKCMDGGLVLVRHEEIRDELAHLILQDLSYSVICKEPFIKPVTPTKFTDDMTEVERLAAQETFEAEAEKALWGELSIREFWRRKPQCIVDLWLTDTNKLFYIQKKVDRVLR